MLNYTRLDQIRQMRPLLHCVSNIVSANDCANLALAIGASPMMAQAAEEMEEITRISSATVLNTGTPDKDRFSVCRLCGSVAKTLGQPLIVDPVGVGASQWRRKEVEMLLKESRPTILRVNLGEAEALCHHRCLEQGVDSTLEATQEIRLDLAGELAASYGTVVLLTGEEDYITDSRHCFRVSGGSKRTTQVTGTGCMLSILCAAFASVEEDALQAAALAAVFWKICAERAEKNSKGLGSGTFRTELINAAELLETKDLEEHGRYRVIRGSH